MADASDTIEGIKILLKYKKGRDLQISAEHDVIYSNLMVEETLDLISLEDKRMLENFGWFESSEFGSWAKFT